MVGQSREREGGGSQRGGERGIPPIYCCFCCHIGPISVGGERERHESVNVVVLSRKKKESLYGSNGLFGY